MNMDSIGHLQELAIKYEARDKYRREGLLENPYPRNGIESIIWDREVMEIIKEADKAP